MKTIVVSAPGKLHLLGEHVVVYGKPAIIAAVNKRCFTTISSPSPSPTPLGRGYKVRISSQNSQSFLNISGFFTEKEIVEKTEHARKQWESYVKTNDISLLKSVTPGELDYVLIAIGETLRYFKERLSCGFMLTIRSDIPIGSGMGSSAALAVSIAGAVSLLFNKNLDKEVINEIAFLAEQKKHGFPSGGDNSASCFGGMIWYRKETPDLKIIKPIPFSLPQKLAKNFVAIYTGTPVESTGEMVSMVRNLYKEKPEFVENILSSQEELVRDLLSAIENEDHTLMIYIIRAGEKNLESLGVVSGFAKSIIREIEKIGGAAKICGAGGKLRSSGVVLAYYKNRELLNDIVKQYSFSSEPIVLGAEGVRQE